MPIRRWLYRAGQFGRAVGVRPSRSDLALADRYLTPAERRYFNATAPRDQYHHVRTLRILMRRRDPSVALARAALLHDIGKGHIRLHERVLYVVLAAAAPRLLERLSRREARGPLGALYRTRYHAETGAAIMRDLGASLREIELVARHHDPPGDDDELRELIRADERA